MFFSPFAIPIVGIIAGVLMALGFPLVRAYARRLEQSPATARIPDELQHRLQRMEQAIDAIAVEVERIAENQRFTTRLLAEQREQAQLGSGAPHGGA